MNQNEAIFFAVMTAALAVSCANEGTQFRGQKANPKKADTLIEPSPSAAPDAAVNGAVASPSPSPVAQALPEPEPVLDNETFELSTWVFRLADLGLRYENETETVLANDGGCNVASDFGVVFDEIREKKIFLPDSARAACRIKKIDNEPVVAAVSDLERLSRGLAKSCRNRGFFERRGFSAGSSVERQVIARALIEQSRALRALLNPPNVIETPELTIQVQKTDGEVNNTEGQK